MTSTITTSLGTPEEDPDEDATPMALPSGVTLRTWQRKALSRYLQHPRDRDSFLASVCPGAGKTLWAAVVGRRLIDQGVIDKVIVVVPSDNLRANWPRDAKLGGLELRRYRGGPVHLPKEFDGIVMTYQQLAVGASPLLIRQWIGDPSNSGRRVAIILDEIHHVGSVGDETEDEGKAWWRGIKSAFEYAVRKITVTGTPWRKKNDQIPWAEYDNDTGKVQVDYSYTYGQAVVDKVCRATTFYTYDGEATWRVWEDGQLAPYKKVVEVGPDLADADVFQALNVLYDPDNAWFPEIFKQANTALQQKQQTIMHHNAAIRSHRPISVTRDGIAAHVSLKDQRLAVPAGIVVASTQDHARAIAEKIHQITGKRPALILSDDEEDAKDALTAFRDSDQSWVVAVKMISEGIDVPRLAVGVYASCIRTPLFLIQVVGRTARRKAAEPEQFAAEWFLPAVPALVDIAFKIEDEIRHRLREPKGPGGGGGGGGTPPIIPGEASPPTLDQAIHSGEGYESSDVERAQETIAEYGFAPDSLIAMMKLLNSMDGQPAATAEPPFTDTQQAAAAEEDLDTKMARLIRTIHKQASRVDHHRGWLKGTANGKLKKLRKYRLREDLTLDELEAELNIVCSWDRDTSEPPEPRWDGIVE